MHHLLELMQRRVELCFGAIALIFGLIFIVITPPLKSPDEGGHFVRAYQFATRGMPAATEVLIDVPVEAAVAENCMKWVNIFQSHVGKVHMSYEAKDILADISPHEAQQNAPALLFLPRPQAIMFPLAYWPQSLAMAIGSAFHASFLELLYAARFVNFLFCLAITILAVRIIPFGKYALAAVNLLPMIVFERSQIATDGLVIASASLVLASLLSIGECKKAGNKQINISLYVCVCFGLLTLAAGKCLYMIVFALWIPNLTRNWRQWITGFILTLPAVVLAVAWAYFLSSHDFSMHTSRDFAMMEGRAGLIDPTEKYKLLITAPGDVLLRINRTFWRHIFDWFGQMIGIFGAMDVIFPMPLRFLGFFWIAALVWSEGTQKHVATKQQITILLLVFWVQVFLVILTIFLIWADPASPYVGGVQGRYFLPLFPCLVLGLSQVFSHKTSSLFSQKNRFAIAFIPAIFLLVSATITVVCKEWL